MEASGVVIGHSKNFIDRRYAVLNSVDSRTIDVDLRVEMLRALLSKTRSVGTDHSVVCNRLRIMKLNDKRESFVVTLEQTT